MTDRLIIALAQLNPTLGAINANLARARKAREQAQEADLILFPELFICGYPPEDLVLRPSFVAACRAAVEDLAKDTATGPAMLMGNEVDIVFVGIGPADFHGPLEESDNFFTAEQLAEVRKAGAVGQLHQRFIDRRGKPVPTPLDDLVIGISLDQLRDAGRRIAVAGGKAKHEALAAALAGEWIDVLVTDAESAKMLLSRPAAAKQVKG